MPSKKKKFIDKKKSVVYRLVHRSQNDPLQTDEEAPEHVLVQVPKPNKVDIKLPQSVLPSSEDRAILSNRSLELKDSQLEWDPDVVAGLEDDFDFNNEENLLEDDFIALANHPIEDSDEGKIEITTENSEENISECDSIACTDNNNQLESECTEYSLTTDKSGFKNEAKSLKRFEKMFSYDDEEEECEEEEEIESIEDDELDACLTTDSQLLNDLEEDFREGNKMFYLSDIRQTMEGAEENKNKIKLMHENEKLIKVVYDVPSKYNSFDCESVLTTQSNLYNHPKIIEVKPEVKPIKCTKNGEIQTNLLMSKGLKKHQLKQLDKEMKLAVCEEREISSDERSKISHSTKTASFVRSKNETPEERKERKLAVKLIRKENRMLKKATKVAFKIEEMRKQVAILNVKQNLKGIKL